MPKQNRKARHEPGRRPRTSEIVERLRDDDRDLFLPDGSIRCQLCGCEPCCCGVPTAYQQAVDALRTEAADEIEAMEAEIARLREALRKVNTAPHTKRCAVRHSVGAETICDCRFTLQDIARSALMVGVEENPDDE